MKKETILIVDDEEDILELIKFNLEIEGYSIVTALTGEKAIEVIKKSAIDLIVLDLMLPGVDGLEVTKILKRDEKTWGIPIIMLTAKGEESDIVTGLELGADDYLSKPFSLKILIARIRAILRRGRAKTPSSRGVIKLEGGMVIDPAKHIVSINSEIVDLTVSEFDLISFLVNKIGWVFTRGQIVDAIRGENYAVTERSVDVIIAGLRKKLKNYAFVIETVRGVGYRFKE
ncbi:MAG: response regulator [Desulfobacula sp.]|nr:response regulator [Desulfobacula sp.]